MTWYQEMLNIVFGTRAVCGATGLCYNYIVAVHVFVRRGVALCFSRELRMRHIHHCSGIVRHNSQMKENQAHHMCLLGSFKDETISFALGSKTDKDILV